MSPRCRTSPTCTPGSAAQIRGVGIGLRLPRLRGRGTEASGLGLIGFGASFGVASLSCTLPIFLSLVAGAIAGGSFAQSMAVFAAYAAGMSLVVISITLALAAGRDRLVERLRPISGRIEATAGWILVLAGGFIVVYWSTVLSVGALGLASNPVARLAETLSGAVARAVRSSPAAVAATVILVAAASWLLRRSRLDAAEEPVEARGASGKGQVARDESR